MSSHAGDHPCLTPVQVSCPDLCCLFHSHQGFSDAIANYLQYVPSRCSPCFTGTNGLWLLGSSCTCCCGPSLPLSRFFLQLLNTYLYIKYVAHSYTSVWCFEEFIQTNLLFPISCSRVEQHLYSHSWQGPVTANGVAVKSDILCMKPWIFPTYGQMPGVECTYWYLCV